MQSLVDAYDCASVPRSDADLHSSLLLMDTGPMQAPSERADVARITHRALNDVDEVLEAARADFCRHFDFINDRARRADPDVVPRRFGRNELRSASRNSGDQLGLAGGESELLLRTIDVLLRDADLARGFANVTHAIAAGQKPECAIDALWSIHQAIARRIFADLGENRTDLFNHFGWFRRSHGRRRRPGPPTQ